LARRRRAFALELAVARGRFERELFSDAFEQLSLSLEPATPDVVTCGDHLVQSLDDRGVHVARHRPTRGVEEPVIAAVERGEIDKLISATTLRTL
jgi:hypothetical protein